MSSAPVISDYSAAAEYLKTLKTRGVHLGLDRMRGFMTALGNPHETVPCIHIAGTNGKGSVAAMLEAILRDAGWRTGLYTSPHLVRLGERVQINRGILSESEIVHYVREMQPIASRLKDAEGASSHPSYFEFMTAMAFLHFARQRCDIAIVEVGMGGRLDATNVITTPEVSVITSIGLDHCDVLGDTLEKIAAEKAGIVKPGRPVVIGRLGESAGAVVRNVAASNNSRVISVAEEFGLDVSCYPKTNLSGDYQRWNAATADLVARALPAKWKVTDAALARGLLSVDGPGRWQEVSVGGRRVILDTSHNPEGAETLERNLAEFVAATRRAPIIVGAAVGISRAQALVPVFCRHAKEIHFVVPAQRRACRHEELESFIAPDFRGRVIRGAVENIFPSADVCTVGVAGETVVVTGSIYLVGEVLARLQPERGPDESGLQDF